MTIYGYKKKRLEEERKKLNLHQRITRIFHKSIQYSFAVASGFQITRFSTNFGFSFLSLTNIRRMDTYRIWI